MPTFHSRISQISYWPELNHIPISKAISGKGNGIAITSFDYTTFTLWGWKRGHHPLALWEEECPQKIASYKKQWVGKITICRVTCSVFHWNFWKIKTQLSWWIGEECALSPLFKKISHTYLMSSCIIYCWLRSSLGEVIYWINSGNYTQLSCENTYQ